MEEEMIKVWQMGMYNYDDIGLDKPVMYKEDFLKQIADDVQTVNITKEHSNEIVSSLSNLKYVNGVLYAERPSDIDITGNGLSPVFDCDLVDMGDYYEPRNFTMTSVGLTKNPRSNILYNSIEKEMDKVSDELRAMLDKKEEVIVAAVDAVKEKSKSKTSNISNSLYSENNENDNKSKGFGNFFKNIMNGSKNEFMPNSENVVEQVYNDKIKGGYENNTVPVIENDKEQEFSNMIVKGDGSIELKGTEELKKDEFKQNTNLQRLMKELDANLEKMNMKNFSIEKSENEVNDVEDVNRIENNNDTIVIEENSASNVIGNNIKDGNEINDVNKETTNPKTNIERKLKGLKFMLKPV